MAEPRITQNRTTITDPSLADLLKEQGRQLMLNMNCHALATIQSFNSDTQTVTATINYKRSMQRRATDGTYGIVYIDYPILLDVPVIILSGGAFQLTFPIAAGDTCMILFNDRDMDNWLESGQIGPVASPRLHSFADGVALIGLRPSSSPIANYDATRAKLFNGDTMVGVSAEKVKIANTLYTLNGLLQDLLTQIQAITVTCAAPASPSSTPINAAAISAIATQIGNLLE